jgi:hypothetical protein
VFKPPRNASLALWLLRANGLLWLAFGILTGAGFHPGIPDTPSVRWGLTGLAIAAAALLFGLDYFLRRHSRIAFWAVLALLTAIAISIIFDQFGLPDLAVLLLTLAPIPLLVRERAWFLQPEPAATAGGRPA